ncbi:MAG: hypothetical protein H7328_10025 [Bdellovibrio sp.]|nr:hypothetical protein [Bdellovibrio sp.]
MKFFIFLLSMFMVTNAFAANYDYKKYWEHEELKAANVQLSFYTKNSPVAKLKNIATMTISKDNKESFDSVLGTFKRSLGTTKWAVQTVDGLDIHESFEPHSNALYRLAFNKKTNQYSIGSVKLRFLLPSYLELHQLQVEKLTGSPTRKTASLLYEIFIPKVQADIKSILSSVGGALTKDLNLAGGAFTKDLNTSIKTGAMEIRAGGSDIRAGLDNAAVSGRELSSTARDLLSPKSVAKLTAITALTAAAVNCLTTYAAQGTWELMKRAYYEVKGEFPTEEKEERIKSFEASLKSFKKLSPEMEGLETKLTVYANTVSTISNLPAETSLAQIDADIAKLKQSQTEAAVALEGCGDCTKKRVLEIKQLEEMKQIIKEAGGTVASAQKLSCEKLDQSFEAWTDAESQLTIARASIVRDARVFMGLVSSTAQPELVMQEQRKQNNSCANPLESRISKITPDDKDFCENNPRSNRTVCENIRYIQKDFASCNVAASAKISDSTLSKLAKNAANFNEKISDLSKELSTADCVEAKNGACTTPGPYEQIQASIESKLRATYKQCPDREFAKSIARGESSVKALEDAVAAKNVAKSETSMPSQIPKLFSELFSKIKSAASAQRAASSYQNTAIVGN